MGSQPCTQSLRRRRFWPRTRLPLPESPRQEMMGPLRPQMQNQDLGRPQPSRALGSPQGRRPQRLFVACARSTGPTSVDPRWAGVVGLSWEATSGCLPELSTWPDGPVTGPADTSGWAGAAPRRTMVPWPRNVARLHLPGGPRRRGSQGSPAPVPGGNPQTGSRAVRRVGGG